MTSAVELLFFFSILTYVKDPLFQIPVKKYFLVRVSTSRFPEQHQAIANIYVWTIRHERTVRCRYLSLVYSLQSYAEKTAQYSTVVGNVHVHCLKRALVLCVSRKHGYSCCLLLIWGGISKARGMNTYIRIQYELKIQ